MAGRFSKACARILDDWRLLGPLVAANVVAVAFGWYYYYDVGQFDPHSPFYEAPGWWPLVADSPNALVVFLAAVALRRLGHRNRFVDAAAFLLNVYVGVWTTFLFLAYAREMGTFEGGTNSLLFVTHMGMPLQALLLAPRLADDRWGWDALAGVAVLAGAYVAVDYAGPTLHPAPFLHPDDGLLHEVSPWLMAAATAAFVVVARYRTGQGVDEAD